MSESEPLSPPAGYDDTHDSAESLSALRVSHIAHTSLSDLAASIQGLRRDALREALTAHGATRVAATLGISRTALHALTREPGTPRHRVPHPSEPAPTGHAEAPDPWEPGASVTF